MTDTLFDLDRVFALMERINWSPERLHRHRTERLRDLLRHAINNSSWYRRRLDDLNPETAQLTDLASLPVLTKDDLMEHWDEIVTVPGITLDRCRTHLSTMPEDPGFTDFLLEGRVVSSTGGTSGKQAVIIRDRDEWVDTFFTMARWPIRAALEEGQVPSADQVRAVISGDSPRHLATAWSKAMGIELVPVSLPLAEQCRRLEDLAPEILTGYSSGLAMIAKAAIAGELSINPVSITASGECLTDDFRDLIKTAWPGVRIHNGYGCTECGAIASSTGLDTSLYVNDDFYVVEGLDASFAPVAAGTVSNSAAVTCLETRAMPLIRYELQDRIEFTAEPSPEGLAQTRIHSIGGRTTDWLKWAETQIHPYVFTTPLTDDPAVDIYQIRQTPDGADIHIVPTGKATLDQERLLEEMRKGLRTAGAPNDLTITIVDNIPRIGDGQKHRVLVPLG